MSSASKMFGYGLNTYTEWDAKNAATATEIAGILEKQFPGYIWMVAPCVEAGYADVRLMNVSAKYGYRINLKRDYFEDPSRRIVIKAGGEIVDRYRLSVRADEAKLASLRQIAGETIGDLSTMANGAKAPEIMTIGWDLFK